MVVRGRSLRLLNGVLRPRRAIGGDAGVINNDTSCTTTVRDAYAFESTIDYDRCGTKKEVH